MSSSPRVFYNHSRHTLEINNLKAPIDVLTFHGVEGLSQPFLYTIEFTSAEQDISVEQVLNQRAWFSLHAPPVKNPVFFQTPVSTLLRTFYGVITGFQRLSASRDEARHVAFGMSHLAWQMAQDPDLKHRLNAAVERRYDELASTDGLNEEVFDGLIVLAAGAFTPEAVATGYERVQRLKQEMADGRRARSRH